MNGLIKAISECQYCKDYLPLGAKPIIKVSENARLLIVGQAPSRNGHETGTAWNDKSGDKLREWLSLDKDKFYGDERIAILPIGFCYPGKNSSGDIAPRPECAQLWRNNLHKKLHNVRLTLLIGRYAQAYYLKKKIKSNLTKTVKAYEEYLSDGFLPLVHPSPRNQLWHSQNKWFEVEVIPVLRDKIALLLSENSKFTN